MEQKKKNSVLKKVAGNRDCMFRERYTDKNIRFTFSFMTDWEF